MGFSNMILTFTFKNYILFFEIEKAGNPHKYWISGYSHT